MHGAVGAGGAGVVEGELGDQCMGMGAKFYNHVGLEHGGRGCKIGRW